MPDKKRILVVEDNESTRNLEKDILEEEGFEVDVAKDGVEGLEKIKQNRYDVIISDCNMPRMKGSDLYLEVKKSNPDLAKRFMFASAILSDFIRSTGNKFLQKPFTPEELIEIVQDLIKDIESKFEIAFD
ncbi:MAG TPA: response regulator [Thermodesulfobacteriota bacterium]|nr:response regulator [Thermodesulfobacteriota bacterium]